ncbi:hypothetical protein L6452_14051 [Arctium lappa]|uniref:Uncharacterized protein n=1 Tax=Arctium lappa TaxID=4217 RepID=A0ACB9CK06_ARCLA|nr:hypothetical protein L6452_14051 [Arctium lappa]
MAFVLNATFQPNPNSVYQTEHTFIKSSSGIERNNGFNQLDLPEYPSKEQLQRRLLLTIHEASEVVSFNRLKDKEWISRQYPKVYVEYSDNRSCTRTRDLMIALGHCRANPAGIPIDYTMENAKEATKAMMGKMDMAELKGRSLSASSEEEAESES